MVAAWQRAAGGKCLAAVVGVFGASLACAEVFFAPVTAVPDGDTLWVQSPAGAAPRKLRLQGLDAPEICQAGGVAARDALRALVAQKVVRVDVRYADDYGRGLAHVQVDGADVGAALVLAGHAWSSGWRRSRGPYAVQEDEARSARAGLFADPDPEPPRRFRQRNGSCYVRDVDGSFKLK